MTTLSLWDLTLSCIDILSLMKNWDLHNTANAWMYLIGDWVSLFVSSIPMLALLFINCSTFIRDVITYNIKGPFFLFGHMFQNECCNVILEHLQESFYNSLFKLLFRESFAKKIVFYIFSFSNNFSISCMQSKESFSLSIFG
jgi:hypothetical protein